MADLKLDLLTKLKTVIYYAEIELVRLAQETNMCYEQKTDDMLIVLARIATANAKIDLVGKYFQDAPKPSQKQEVPQQPAETKPTGKVHQGQSHGE